MPKVDLKTKYPEHAKLDEIKDKLQTIGEFLEWLGTKGRELCTHQKEGYCQIDEDSDPEHQDEGWFPLNYTIEKLLAEFFEIDLNKLEQEKRQMLDEIR